MTLVSILLDKIPSPRLRQLWKLVKYHFNDLISFLSTAGDYELQRAIIDTLFHLTRAPERDAFAKNVFKDLSPLLSNFLAINEDRFEAVILYPLVVPLLKLKIKYFSVMIFFKTDM